MWRQRTDEAGGPSLERAECRGRRAARAASAWAGGAPGGGARAPHGGVLVPLVGAESGAELGGWSRRGDSPRPWLETGSDGPPGVGKLRASGRQRRGEGGSAVRRRPGGGGRGRGASAEDVRHLRGLGSGSDLCPRPAPPAPPPGVWTCAERSAGRRRGNGPVSPVPATARRRVRARSSESPVTQFPPSFCASFFPLEGTRRLPGPVRRTSQLSSRLSANDPRRGGAVIVLRPLLRPSPRPRSCCSRGSRTARALLQGPRPRLWAHGPSPGLASVLRRFSVPV